MFRIIKTDGTELGVTESVNYIKIHKNGCYTTATKEDAIGIAFRSTPYNLMGHEDIADADTVFVREIDVDSIFEQYATYDALAKAYHEGVQEA